MKNLKDTYRENWMKILMDEQKMTVAEARKKLITKGRYFYQLGYKGVWLWQFRKIEPVINFKHMIEMIRVNKDAELLKTKDQAFSYNIPVDPMNFKMFDVVNYLTPP
jgi:hypothetical protein